MKFDFILTNLKKYAVYIGFLAITLIASIILTVWSVKTPSTGTVEIIKTATAHINEGTIVEYLAGEQVDVEFVTLELEDGRVLTADEYTVEADLTTAGKKAVSLVYTENGVKHVGTYTVEVFLIRHFDLRSYPRVVVTSGGQPSLNGLILWAELSGIPTSGRFATTPEHPDWKNTVVIENGMYTVTIMPKTGTSISTAKLNVGARDVSFDFYEGVSGFDTSKVGNAVAVMPLTNQDENSSSRLTLFVNQKETNNADGTNGASGWYVLEKRVGDVVTYKYYNFSYWIDQGWGSHFTSVDFGQGLVETLAQDTITYSVEVDGETFIAKDGNAWRAAFVAV